jgi:hypothetical protein
VLIAEVGNRELWMMVLLVCCCRLFPSIWEIDCLMIDGRVVSRRGVRRDLSHVLLELFQTQKKI